ncbi:Origin recognition complex subunit 1 [Wickerhamiella sorbophila]|uniref:Origin recognition complex subunit 1 n=1 Tax=Wickerhamiella sorbophila TaxID=45607 RepID=A0A2T0FPH4_9ASCO|nr:Origin recognition complex subunit 1 [Wickerhamiella sorbophila]PRT56884.1 Origin recognition complex subunit 1 [Wickerhamiella sorbophila]
MWELITSGRGRRTQIDGIRGLIGELRPGDIIEVGHGFGIIASFQQTETQELRVRVLFLTQGTEERELILTTAMIYAPVETVKQKITVVTKARFDSVDDAEKDQFYFCYRGQDRKGRFSDEFNFDTLIGNAQGISEQLADLFREKFETPKKKRKVARGLMGTPKKLFPQEIPEPIAEVTFDWSSGSDSEEFKDEETDKMEIDTASSVVDTASPKRAPQTPRKKRAVEIPKTPRSARSKVLPSTPHKHAPSTPHQEARDRLHISSLPDSLPCRESEFSQVFIALESAIQAGTGTCVYVSGTPGVGKTATVREVISQLELRKEDGELPPFVFLEVNGMKLTHPNVVYDLLWKEVSDKPNMSASNGMSALESVFTKKDPSRPVLVVLVDELDQLVTKNQSVMYNLFNWPALPNSKLIVVAIANTMDLPERLLTNKISSRLGLTRIQFRGYTYQELRQIIFSRLEGLDVVDVDAIEYVARKVAGVSGDARRALDLCRRAVELGDGKTIKIDHVREAIMESHVTHMEEFLASLSVVSKVLLCAIIVRARRSKANEVLLREVLQQAEQLVHMGKSSAINAKWLYGSDVRLRGFRYAVQELVEGGLISQQVMKGEATPNIRLNVAPEAMKKILDYDPDVGEML